MNKIEKKKGIKKLEEALDENFFKFPDHSDVDEKGLKGRIAIIADALERQTSLEEANSLLISNGFEKLYARSFDESILMYSFCNGLNFMAWKNLQKRCSENFGDMLLAEMNNILSGTITIEMLKQYLELESEGEEMQTGVVTGLMSKQIETCKSEEELNKYLKINIKNFSNTREKSRYYFCKYLIAYVLDGCNKYLKACKSANKQEERFALEDVAYLKPITALKREAEREKSKLSYEEKESRIYATSISPGGIFDDFNYHYGYISEDWIELIFERFGTVDEWTDELRTDVVEALGIKENVDEKLLKIQNGIEEREKKLDEEYSREGGISRTTLYQRYRLGENYFRTFLNGQRDINRETLIAFILFVAKKVKLNNDLKVDDIRINNILDNCGFEQLNPKYNEFDEFIRDYMKSSEPYIIMEERVDKQIRHGNNFDLYMVYNRAYNHAKEISKLNG